MKINKDKPYIIAEIGINHEGSINLAKRLIIDASKAGADAVKFQIFNPITLANPEIKKTKHQNKNTKKREKLFEMWKRMTFNTNQWKSLKNLAKNKSLDFITSVFDEDSVQKAKDIGVDAYKIASSDLTDFKLFRFLKKIKKPILLSTGMGSKLEIMKAINKIKSKNIYILHCVSLYPCPMNYVNLKRISKLKNEFKKIIGYSDHAIGTSACLGAINLGASIIEKHFTFNKNKLGSDHMLSADLNDLKVICDYAKNFKKINGSGKIVPSKKELGMRKFFRKSLFAKKTINKNETFTFKNIDTRRPGTGIPAETIDKVIGKKSKIKIEKDNQIKLPYIK
jgi:N,N'-diacetyllegionaminate synthase